MVVVKGVSAKMISDSRNERTIEVSIKTNSGNFSASSPNGKSTGKYAKKIYKKSLEEDIRTLKKFNDYFSMEIIEKFEDLRRVEDIVDGHIGANSLFALESCVLKAMAKEQKKEIWQIVNPKAKKLPRLVGNCIGGGKHSPDVRKPDFQEFLLMPDLKSVKESQELNKKNKNNVEQLILERDRDFKSEKNDEDAFITKMNEKEIFDLLKKLKTPLGTDIAASGFYSRKKYYYKNPLIKRDKEEQFRYLVNLITNFNLFYIEDPFEEEDFESFSRLVKKFPNKLIVGDDLIVTNQKRFEKAIKEESVTAIIVKPNQTGSLMEVRNVCELAKKNNIKLVFSHRSGETNESILADLAFGFQADFFKCGITGKEREVKIKRLIEIEKKLNKYL